ncbi:MAG: iron-containing alcohol dehydrogenase [[Clostridium] innocuum]
MENFIYDIPTTVYFGKGQLHQLERIIREYGKRVLLVYGGGSIKRNGIYDEVVLQLQKAGREYVELGGVEPNPSLYTVEKGVAVCRREQVDVIVAIGGGSAIDCAKVVSAAVCSDQTPWELVLHPKEIKRALPVIAVLTIAATGSEMDHIAVITNPETKEKIGTRNPLLRPKAAILDPTFTFSVGAYQTACGVADIMSHTMESYFAREEAELQDRFAEGILKVCIKYGPIVLQEPTHYEARANLMWAASWAINDMLKLGHMTQWSVHPMEHPLSAFYSVTHGEGLAILTPHWMEYVLSEDTVDKFARFAREIWQVEEKDVWDMAREGIERLRGFYEQLHLRSSLGELGIDETHLDAMAMDAARQTVNGYVSLSAEDVKNIYRNSL